MTSFEIRGDKSQPVVALIHGLGMNRHTWDDHIEALTEHFCVLSYDLYGHGVSPAPPEKPTLGLYATQLLDLMDQLEIPAAHVVGFSLGGMINRRLAADHPDVVKSLAILNSPHERTPEAQAAVEQRAIDSAAAGPSANIEATLARWFTEDFRNNHPARVNEIKEWVLSNDAQTYAECRFVLANGVVELVRPEPPITHPSLVMTCEFDTGSTPAMSHAIASEIPGAETIIVPKLQHCGLVEQPRLFTEPLIRFIQKVEAS